MKRSLILCTALIGASTASKADLYFVGDESMDSLPIKWTVGASLVYDDNVLAGRSQTNTPKEDSFAINPYVGASWVNVTPQTTVEVFARLGMVYYFDSPTGSNSANSQSRLGLNVTHRFSERLRWVSRNFVAYELEPDYSRGFANSRIADEYFYWQTQNSLGFRWTERFATYTGFTLSGVDYGGSNDNDRFTWGLNNQFRYQLTPQSVATLDYRYRDTSTSGLGRDSTDHFALLGLEHRFSPNTVGIIRAGFQHRDVTGGSSTSRPSIEFALNSQINDQLRVRAFTRYSMESYDTVRLANNGASLIDFDERQTLRIGVSAEYMLSPRLALNGGVDYVMSDYKGGVVVGGVGPAPSSPSDDIINLYVGVSYQFTDYLFGTLSYNFSDSSSDLDGRDYTRNRISVGVRAEF